MRLRLASLVSALFLVASLVACGKSGGPVSKEGESGGGGGGAKELNGAGATFPYPLYSKWVAEYEKVSDGVKINYQSIGSGGGIKQITEKTVDFGASDAPMKDEELAKASSPILHIPTTLGAVVVAYNVPGVTEPLKLTPDVVAGIFLGEITTWNDPKIAELNAGVTLPGDAISVAYRSDGSGTTAVFTDYLSKVSPAWKEKVGAGKQVKFPVGLGFKGNEGVAGGIQQSPGTVGYIELAYAKQVGIPMASLKNQAGNFVEPSIAGVTAAAAGANLPDDMRVSITDATGADAYPISAFTYILVYEDQSDAAKGKTLADFLWWAVHDGQKYGPDLNYAPLPADVVKRDEEKLKLLKSGGQTLLSAK